MKYRLALDVVVILYKGCINLIAPIKALHESIEQTDAPPISGAKLVQICEINWELITKLTIPRHR